jgi:hypothetical protein
MLDIWPNRDLPIIIDDWRRWNVANLTAALKQRNRVCTMNLRVCDIPSSLLQLEEFDKPFPMLTHLTLHSRDESGVPVLTESFLGGSAPRLRFLILRLIPFPALPNLLLSTHDLFELSLWDIPQSGYISPEAMVACLSALTRLHSFSLGFRFPRFRAVQEPERQHPSLLTRFVLPALTALKFRGYSEYLEDFVSRINTPLLEHFRPTFLNQLIFDTPQLAHFIGRTENLKAPCVAKISFFTKHVELCLYHGMEIDRDRIGLWLEISCHPSDWQLSSVAQVCRSLLSSIPTLERLMITGVRPFWHQDIEHAQWLELLRPFTFAKDLGVSWNLVELVAPALRELSREGVIGVLPALQNIFLEVVAGLRPPPSAEPVQEAIDQFIALRQLSGHPVTVHHPGVRSLTSSLSFQSD